MKGKYEGKMALSNMVCITGGRKRGRKEGVMEGETVEEEEGKEDVRVRVMRGSIHVTGMYMEEEGTRVRGGKGESV